MIYEVVGLLAALAVVPTVVAQEPEVRTAGVERSAIEKAARRIDRAVEAGLRAAGKRPGQAAGDHNYVRRVYLDLVGRIPTLAEIDAFFVMEAPTRRAELVDRLLDSPGHVSQGFNYFADLLRVKTRLAQQTSGEPYIHWLKQALTENRPFDAMVRELLTASGPAHERGNGATGYFMRDRGMPEDNMANTVRVFLGTRLECAQCHNHPFDQWTQRQFYGMAAFTGGMRFTHEEREDDRRRLRRMARDLRDEGGDNVSRAFRRMLRPAAVGIAGTGSGVVPLPDNYQYDDAEPNELVEAQVLFGDNPELTEPPPRKRDRKRRGPARDPDRDLPEANARAAYAAWMTAPDNPRFATVIANRMWKRLMGRGVIEPVDNITTQTEPADPGLMRVLAELMVELDYDLVQFQRAICYSDAYQREARSGEAGDFVGPAMRRLSAEQIWDSLLTLVVDDVDGKLADPGAAAERVYREFEDMVGMSADDVRERVDREMVRYTDPDAYREMRREERRERAAMEGEPRRALKDEMRELRRAIARARRARDPERRGELEEELARKTMEFRAQRSLKRASDLPSPAPEGHPLRQFGQSDREQIEASHTDANVPQVLTLLNGFVDQKIMRRESLVMRRIEGAPDAAAKIETAFTAILSRPPTDDELRTWIRDVEQHGADACRDLVWVLLNTNEFRFAR